MEKGKQIHIGHTDIKINYTESDSKKQVSSLNLLKVGEWKYNWNQKDSISYSKPRRCREAKQSEDQEHNRKWPDNTY